MKQIAAVARAFAFCFVSFHAPFAIAQGLRAAGSPGVADTTSPIPAAATTPASVFPTQGWSSLTPMPSARWAHAMASYSIGTYPTNSAFIYVISGADAGFASTNLLSRYDVDLHSWSNLAPMPAARTQIGAVQVGGKIYVPAGYSTGFVATADLNIYDIAANTWGSGASLPQATGDYAIGTYASRYVYVIGGYSGSTDLNNVQVYDTAMNAWQSATPKPGTATSGLRGGIVGNKIVVVGGYNVSLGIEFADAYVGTIDAMNPAVIAWAPIAAYPGGAAGRLGAGVPVAAGPAQGVTGLNFVVFTGGDPNGSGTAVKNDTWIYDFNDSSWKSAQDKPTGVSNISNLAGVSSGGKLHLVSTGGFNGSGIITVNEWLTFGFEAPPDLALTGSAGSVDVDAGSPLAYTWAYTVGSPASADNVTITDIVPAGALFDAAASTAGWTCTPDHNAGSVCTFSLGSLPATAHGSVLFAVDTFNPPPSGATQIDNVASIISAAPFGQEQDLSNNTASVSTPYSTRIFADGFELP